MIRAAVKADFDRPITEETDVRIRCLYLAYGNEVSFVRFYSDGVGGMLAVMDGVGLFSPAQEVTEEWVVFLGMNSDIRQLHCSAKSGLIIAESLGWHLQTGSVLRYEGQTPTEQEGVCREPKLPEVHKLLEQCFPGVSSLDAWYPDVSHRIRHGYCHIACVTDGDTVISTAMTVAEANNAAVLGQVATAEAHRRRGYAAKCIQDLIFRCKASSLYILPINETAQKLYISLGFQQNGQWTELTRTAGGQ